MSSLNNPRIIIFRFTVKKTENRPHFIVFKLNYCNLVNFGLRKLVKLSKFIKKIDEK